MGQESQHTQAPPQLNKITINQHSQPSQVTSTISQYQYNSRNMAPSNTKTLSFISVQPHLLSPGQILILRRSMRFETKNSKLFCHNPSPSPNSKGLGVTLFCCATHHNPPHKLFSATRHPIELKFPQ